MDTFMDIFGWILKILSGYTAVMGICFLLPRKKKPVAEPKTKFAVLVAARDEENVIGALVDSLVKQDYPDALYDIIVIPNNCTDDTEGAAIRAGAKIFHCEEPVKSKGEVLHQVFDKLMGTGYDAYCVFDADNVVDSAFLARMNDVVVAGGLAAKSRQCALNPYDNWVSGCYDLYFENINLLHSRARAAFPLSAKLVGTGFMVTDELMQRLGGWNTVTITEDLEFAAQCAAIGVQVHYVPEALTLDEEPLSFRVSMRQRMRWSSGVQSVGNRYFFRLLFMKPKWLRWDLAIHTVMIHVQLLALIPLFYGMIHMDPVAILKTLGISAATFWLGMIAMAVFLCVSGKRKIRKMWKTILLYPLFVLSWYPLHFRSCVYKTKKWKHIKHGTSKNRREKSGV